MTPAQPMDEFLRRNPGENRHRAAFWDLLLIKDTQKCEVEGFVPLQNY